MRKINESLLCKLTLLLIFCMTNVFAQEIGWQNTIGGTQIDNFKSIQQTSDGGFILGGSSCSNISGDKTENCNGGDDIWILKVDSIGNIQWQNAIGGSFFEYLGSIKETNDGGFIIGGYSNSNISGDKTENCLGYNDYWILKTDAFGNILWQNTIGGDTVDILNSIQQTNDGGYILGGISYSNISGDKTENIIGERDYWIIKIDSLGSILWQNTLGGNGADDLFSVQQTTDGGYILGGSSTSNISGDKTENCLGGLDYWIIKTDHFGNILWQKTIGGSSDDLLFDIRQTVDGGYIFGGSSGSNISFYKSENNLDPSLFTSDFWIVKTDSNGTILWDNTIGGSKADRFQSVEQTLDGGYVLGGASISNISGDKTENCLGLDDYWIVKVDSIGIVQWQNTIGGDSYDGRSSIIQTYNEEYIVGGQSWSCISGDKIENCIGGYDFWILKVSENNIFITGKLFADFNSNSFQDFGEPFLAGRKITEQNTGLFAFSDQNGQYSISVFDSGQFLMSPQSMMWYNSSPVSHSATFTGINQIDSLNDFAFQPLGAFEDVCITITPLGNFRSGFNASYLISYGNYGTTTVAPTVYFYPYSNVSYLSASVTPNLVTPDSIVWSFPPMSPFQTGSIIVTVNVNLGLLNGTLINSSAHIEPYLTDDNPSCNNSNWNVYTTGAVDPNDILVSEDTLTTTQLSNAPWLDYIIRFQNTGNDTAFTVKIINPIDTFKLNISSIEFVNASHPVNLNWINYQRNMEFKFENILLVDRNTNEPLSHGFVRYRIQPKTNLSAGDTITNFAAIYFDFNEPIITNTAKTIIVLPTGLTAATPARGKLHVFPNPTENTLNISGIHLENGKAQLRLMDIYGKLILEKTITSITTTLETIALSSGIYLIQSGELRATFVKQ
jgi:hypothetical protein